MSIHYLPVWLFPWTAHFFAFPHLAPLVLHFLLSLPRCDFVSPDFSQGHTHSSFEIGIFFISVLPEVISSSKECQTTLMSGTGFPLILPISSFFPLVVTFRFCFLAYRWLTPFACGWDSLLIYLSWVFLPGTVTERRYPHWVKSLPRTSSYAVFCHTALFFLLTSCQGLTSCHADSLYFTLRSHRSDFIPLLRFSLDAVLAMETVNSCSIFPVLELVKYFILKWITNLRPCVIVICSCFIILILLLFIDFQLKLNFAKIRYQDVKRHGASLPFDLWSMEWSGLFTKILGWINWRHW